MLLFECKHFWYANPGPLSVSFWTCLSMQAKFQTAAKKNHQHTPVMVLTATAPPDVLEILKSILTDPAVYKTSFDHPNITFTARRSKFGGKIPKAIVDGKTLPGKIQIKVTLCYCMSVIRCSL